MEIYLDQTSIKNNLQKVGFEIAKGLVETDYMNADLSLIGFIPYNVYKNNLHFSLSVNLNERIIVTPYLVRFDNKSYPIPLFKKIELAKDEKYIINNDLLIDTRLEDVPKPFKGRFLDNDPLHPLPIPGDKFKMYIKKASNRPYLKKNEEDTYYYIGQDGELLLSQNALNVCCISNDFVCLCSYENKVTGLLSYIVLPSNDIIRKESIKISNL
ncbi:MAG: hypothetical protein SPL78_10475 [Bacteroidales bacterium]|nr:hypothetical protein [Bacteroidales bacterium]